MTKNVTIYKKYDGTWVVKFHRVISSRLSKYEEIKAKEAIRKVLVAMDREVKHAT